ncbi:conserved hypothetical protein [Aggregatibacter aphrophilus NJ8700]|nr:conserved hypothetical protein [Aggregatibacter aphrophilus NJ8700]
MQKGDWFLIREIKQSPRLENLHKTIKKQSNEAKLQKSKAAYQISHPIESYVYEKAPFWRRVLAVLINILLFYLFMIFSIFFIIKVMSLRF